MPTMTSKKLSDLESERESFLRHEQRIIQERDEILTNLRNHLDQLDTEIVRLGGTARASAAANAGNANTSLTSSDSGFVSSIAPFPSVKSDSAEGKKPRPRPRKSDESSATYEAKKAEDRSGGNQKKSRDTQKKEKVPSPVEKENASSNNASGSNDKAVESSDGQKKKRGRPTKDSSTPAAKSMSSSDLAKVEDAKGGKKSSKDGKKRQYYTPASPAQEGHTCEAWTCECGENMAAGRARCGKCRRWKGGKRQKRWTMGGKQASKAAGKAAGTNESASDRSRRSEARKKRKVTDSSSKSAVDVYKSLPPAEQKSATDGAAILANMATAKDPRSEVEAIMRHMVSSVSHWSQLGDLGQPNNMTSTGMSKKNEEENMTAEKKAGKAEEVAPVKRKRGRPRKDDSSKVVVAQEQSIQRVVSTSDSESDLVKQAPPKRGRGRPRKNPVMNGTAVEPSKEQKGAAIEEKQNLKQPDLGANETENAGANGKQSNESTTLHADQNKVNAEAGAPVSTLEESILFRGNDEREQLASDCLQYFQAKEQEFTSSPTTYDELVKVIREYKSKEVDIVALICRIMTLLDGHKNLILGINAFLPEKYKIDEKDLKSESSS